MLDVGQGDAVHPRAWYALYVRSQYERKVVNSLERFAIERYLPVYSERSRWSDRIKIVERPLFPGYVFSRLAPEQRRSTLDIPGVVRIVGAGSKAVPIDDCEIEAVRRIVQSGLLLTPIPLFTGGQKVRVVSGSLAGLEGSVIRGARNSLRLVVSVPLLGRSVAAEIDAVNLVPVTAALQHAA